MNPSRITTATLVLLAGSALPLRSATKPPSPEPSSAMARTQDHPPRRADARALQRPGRDPARLHREGSLVLEKARLRRRFQKARQRPHPERASRRRDLRLRGRPPRHEKSPFSALGEIKMEDFKVTDTTVSGRVTTGGELDAFGQKWNVDLVFSAPLPKGAFAGEEPKPMTKAEPKEEPANPRTQARRFPSCRCRFGARRRIQGVVVTSTSVPMPCQRGGRRFFPRS